MSRCRKFLDAHVERMKLSLLALVLMGLGSGCIHRLNPDAMVFHADTTFSQWERDCMEDSSDQWRKQTNGVADVEFVWDHTPGTPYTGDHLTRWTDEDAKAEDVRIGSGVGNEGKFILGEVIPTKPMEMRMVMSRFESTESCRLAAMHEIGHAFGMPHAKLKSSIMYPIVLPNRTMCLKNEDLVSFCTVNVCNNVQMKPCGAEDQPSWPFILQKHGPK